MNIDEIIENLEDQVDNIECITKIPTEKRNTLIDHLNAVIDYLNSEEYDLDDENDYDEEEEW